MRLEVLSEVGEEMEDAGLGGVGGSTSTSGIGSVILTLGITQSAGVVVSPEESLLSEIDIADKLIELMTSANGSPAGATVTG